MHRHIFLLYFLSILIVGCNKRDIKKTVSENDSVKNQNVLSEQLIKSKNLSDENLKKIQFRNEKKIIIDLFEKTPNPCLETDTIKLNIRTVVIKKLTKCKILQNGWVDPNENTERISTIKNGYLVDFGKGTQLMYMPLFKYFSSVIKINGEFVKNERAKFTQNSSLIFNTKKPIVSYTRKDTTFISSH